MQNFKNYVATKITQIERKYDENPTAFVITAAGAFVVVSLLVIAVCVAP